MPNGFLLVLSVLAMCVTSFILGCIPSMKISKKEVGSITIFKSPDSDQMYICKLSVTPETLNNANILLNANHVALKVIDRSNEYYREESGNSRYYY